VDFRMNYESSLSQSIQSVKPSGIRKFFDILDEMTDAISLGIGEPDFVTPWHIRDAGIYSLEKGKTAYTSNAGMAELRREISAYLQRRMNLNYSYKDQILTTVGGSEAIDVAFRVLLNPGDEAIIPVPSFVCYGPLCTMCGGTPVYVETKAENEFRLTADELKAVITPKTKLLVLPFPNNPTGAIMEQSDLEAIAEVLRGTDIIVVSDEIYAELTYGQRHVSFATIPDMYERTVYCSGFSKSYAMTGWRLGYLCGPAPIVAQATKLHQYGIMSAPTMSQYAAIEACRNGDHDIETMREEYDARRRFLVKGLRDIGLACFEPKGAFYVFPDIRSTGLTSEDFCERFLRAEKVAVIAGSAFGAGGEGFVRCCYASSMQNIATAVERMDRFISHL